MAALYDNNTNNQLQMSVNGTHSRTLPKAFCLLNYGGAQWYYTIYILGGTKFSRFGHFKVFRE